MNQKYDDVSAALDRSIARLQGSVRRAAPLTQDEKQMLRFLIRDLAPLCDYDEGAGHLRRPGEAGA